MVVLACAGWAGIAHGVPGRHWLHLGAWAMVSSEIYVLAGLAALALAVRTALHRAAPHRAHQADVSPWLVEAGPVLTGVGGDQPGSRPR